MIEDKIIEWIELGDSIQKIDIYNKQYTHILFQGYYLLSQFGQFPEYFYLLNIFLFFAQIWELNLLKIDVEDDGILEILKYLENVFLFHKFVINNKTFSILLAVTVSIYILYILLLIINIILIKKKIKIIFFISLNSFLNILIMYFINGPSLYILLTTVLCYDNNSIVLCSFKNVSFIISFILISIYAIFMVLSLFFSSLYFNNIGKINGSNAKCRINCNFTTIIIIIKLIYTIFNFILTISTEEKIKYGINTYYLFIFCGNLFISIYTYKYLFYYNQIINKSFHYGWYFTTWFSFCIFLKKLIGINDITLYIIFGSFIITIGFIYSNKYKEIKLMTEFNMLEENSLKDIEIFNYLLINYLKKNDLQSKIIIAGIIKRFEEYISINAELYDMYHKFLNDKHLQRKFTSKNELSILSIISIIYSSSIEKSKDKTDITLNMCYFLVNIFKNPTYSIWLCTKIKSFSHVQSYNTFVLMEEIKEYLIGLLKKNSHKMSIKHIQFSSAILYYQYIELFKMKIYDATCSQIEYFDILKNSTTTGKTTENFLNIGKDILSLRKDILNLWEKIMLLNPFSIESKRDYMIYLDNVLQDQTLLKTEEKRFNSNRDLKLADRNNTYYSIYIQELSAVLLIDGYSYNGKVIYATSNFPSLFMFTEKEILNITIDDLLPDVIQNFHKFLIEDSIKYSNLGYIFKKQIDALLKGKNGLIFNVYLFIRPVPNLTFGLIYFCYIQKIKEQNFILILDKNLYINGFTVTNGIDSNFTMNNNNFGLTNYINGHHIGLIIPEILLQMEYDEKSDAFSLTKTRIDLKGNLYPISNFQNSKEKIKVILDAIKTAKNNEFDRGNKLTLFDEYDEFIKYLNSINSKSYSIFFKIEFLSFIGGRYKYYRIYVTKDLLSCTDNSLEIESKINSLNFEEEMNLNDDLNNTNQMNNLSYFKFKANTKKSHHHKLIKLKTNLNKKNNVNEENEFNEQNDINEKKLNKDNKNNSQNLLDNLNSKRKRSNPSSNLTHSNSESVKYNKLKNEIINKSDSFYIKLMKYLCIIFAIINLALISYDFLFSLTIINIMVEFLKQNLFFSHTKICAACIYYSAVNLKLLKKGYFEQDFCIIKKCYDAYGELLEKCLKEIRHQKHNISLFYQDYQNIFNQKIHVSLDIYNRPFTNHLNLDINNFLNLIISHGMKILANLKDMFESNLDQDTMGTLEAYLSNLIKNSLLYFYSDYIGFYGEEKQLKCQNASKNPPIRILISTLLIIFLMIIFIYLINYINSMELYFLDRLINFTSSSFEEYLKNLDELKKKFRNDTNDEDDKNGDELNPNGDDVDLEKENNSKIKNENNNNKDKNPKNKKSKQNKILQQKLKKKKYMSKYFYKLNTFFGLKIGIIFLLPTIYYFITTIITSLIKQKHKKFDSVVEQIDKVYFDSFGIFLIFLEQIENFSNNNNKSLLKFPEDSEIEKQSFGNSMLYIYNNYKNSEEATKLLDIIYNNNACQAIAEDTFNNILCEQILSSIITKGMEQAVIQMNIIITSVIDELNTLKEHKTINDIIHQNSTYSEYELFMGKFMLFSFLKTHEIIEIFRNSEKSYIFRISRIILFIYGIIYCFLIIFVFCFISSYKNVINSFFNFIGILPSKFICNDEYFYNTILKLEGDFY